MILIFVFAAASSAMASLQADLVGASTESNADNSAE
jgi:hypothetical protein